MRFFSTKEIYTIYFTLPCLLEVHKYSVLMTQAVSVIGEKPYEAPELFKSALKEAHKEFAVGRLYLPADVTKLADAFFQKITERHLQVFFAQLESTNDQTRDQYWGKARTIASQEIPALLHTIEEEARIIIHGKQDA